jgi:hypothetical protein
MYPTAVRPGNLLGFGPDGPKCLAMGEDDSITALRSRVAALVEQEGALLTRAFDLSRAGGDRQGVEALFAQVQAIQVERNGLKKQIGNILGTHRLHEASEVWRPGVYDYRHEVGRESVRVRVTRGALGLQVLMPGQREPVRIETLRGTFDGPLAVDDSAAHQDAADPRPESAKSPASTPADAGKPRRRAPAKKKPL